MIFQGDEKGDMSHEGFRSDWFFLKTNSVWTIKGIFSYQKETYFSIRSHFMFCILNYAFKCSATPK